VDYVKEETPPPGPVITAILQLAGEHCKGVMGGQGGAYLIEEYRRGACGNMPACEITDTLVDLWDLLDSGKEEEARSVFHRLLPLFNIERMYPMTAYKTILNLRGVIDSPYMRIPRRRDLDDYVLHELKLALRQIGDLLTCRKYPVRV
jgi:4-hydroxy-tetrahydrodipicolinate synthase